MSDRAAHLEWCKERALAYVDGGDLTNALASITSDLRKHPTTEYHPGMVLGTALAMNGHLATPDRMREWIEGIR